MKLMKNQSLIDANCEMESACFILSVSLIYSILFHFYFVKYCAKINNK